MDRAGSLRRAREAFAARAWATAHARLAAADAEEALRAEDLERLATAAYLAGHDTDAVAAWERAHRIHLEEGEIPRAIRSAFWIAFVLLHRGETARGGGWLARAQRLLAEVGRDCVERGYLLFPLGLKAILDGDPGRGPASSRRPPGSVSTTTTAT